MSQALHFGLLKKKLVDLWETLVSLRKSLWDLGEFGGQGIFWRRAGELPGTGMGLDFLTVFSHGPAQGISTGSPFSSVLTSLLLQECSQLEVACGVDLDLFPVWVGNSDAWRSEL